ncbi:AraC family transcriptional regulator [Marinilabilia rubra]|uniref:AraC family transcriptional regulator n=1 Tax=Marinilabilia rubra TaxID=2162893 RepID=A0A2U2B5F8_9BACT|nr:AraC family transcriptional regulator [Marinilabilia rubra]PWD98310.1 AraC family transcriptional regulator [Marinilabilia rubra]
MQAKYHKLTKQLHQSIAIRKDTRMAFFDHWHYHSELELVYILQGKGTRFIGDDISPFNSGDLVLLGAGLPHVWKSDDVYFESNSKNKVSAIVLHFGANFMGENLWELPEMSSIKELFQISPRGVCYHLPEGHTVKMQLKKMLNQSPFTRLLSLLSILNKLARIDKRSVLSGIPFAEHYQKHQSNRIDKIYDYILSNFDNDIKLEDLALKANMTPASLCRFFKQKTRKSISECINEVRIGFACKLLIEDNFSISEICFRCGYNNLSYFNRQFKNIIGLTPGNYQKKKSLFEETKSKD